MSAQEHEPKRETIARSTGMYEMLQNDDTIVHMRVLIKKDLANLGLDLNLVTSSYTPIEKKALKSSLDIVTDAVYFVAFQVANQQTQQETDEFTYSQKLTAFFGISLNPNMPQAAIDIFQQVLDDRIANPDLDEDSMIDIADRVFQETRLKTLPT